MSNCVTIHLPEVDKKITQRKTDKQVNIANLGNKYITLVQNTINNENKDCIQFLKELSNKHNLKKKKEFLKQVDGNQFWINANLLIYVLNFGDNQIKHTCCDKLDYDIYLTHRKLIIDKDLYFESSFYVNFIDLQKLDLYTNVKNATKDNEIFYSLESFQSYISFLYLQNPKDLEITKTLSKLKLFLHYEYQGNFNKTSTIKFVNIILDKTELYNFAKTGTLFCNEEHLKITNLRKNSEKIKIKCTQKEKDYQCKLLQKYGGKTEVKTPVGYIDLLTDTTLYELKHYTGWKGAIGQLTSYGHYYPNHEKVLVVFDLPANYDDTNLKLICETLDIGVEYV